jgi:hypothetical protein
MIAYSTPGFISRTIKPSRLDIVLSAMTCTHITAEPGVYRIEAYRRYLSKRRGWIYSNPIYVR